MVSANKFDCHSPVPVQNPVQVQVSTSTEYGEDVGGTVLRNWEYDRQEKRREQATCSHARHCWDNLCECGLFSNTEVCASVSRRKWGIASDSMAHTSNWSTHASVQYPCLPVSDNCVPSKSDKICRGIRWSLAAESSHSSYRVIRRTKCSAVLPKLCLNWSRGSRKVVHRSQEECSPVLYRTLYYAFKRFESPKGLTSTMSSTMLPIYEILILVCYFETAFI